MSGALGVVIMLQVTGHAGGVPIATLERGRSVEFPSEGNSMSSYRQALKTARTEYIRKLIDNHQNNPRFLFSTVARLTNKQMSPDLNIPSQFNSNDFMNCLPVALLSSVACELAPLRIVLLCVFLYLFFFFFSLLF